jgi:hypothetical protein
MFFLIAGFLFLAGAIYNIFNKNYSELCVGLAISLTMFVIYFSRKKIIIKDINAIASKQPQRCCKCGESQNVRMRAYMLCYSLLFYTSKSPGAFRPICDSCRISAGLPYSLGTVLLGWWGIPWGPIFTIRCLIENFKGGIIADNHTKPEPLHEDIVAPAALAIHADLDPIRLE